MLSEKEFVDFILSGDADDASPAPSKDTAALPEGFEGFETAAPSKSSSTGRSSFARRLLEASGFGLAELVQRDNVIRSGDAVAKYLPTRASFWPKTSSRPYQTLLFEADLDHKELLSIPAFKKTKVGHLEDAESALSRLVSEALDGFQRGGEGVTADVRKGRKDETLCVVSIVDKRDAEPVRLVCFGTENKTTGGLETFHLTEQTRLWDPQLAREHLGLLYKRQFKKLAGKDWQEAFTTTEERTQAEKLLAICTRKSPKERDIQEGVLDLLDIIAKAFGLRKKPNSDRRLQAFELPSDHDIGIDADERESSFGGKNPFGGVTLRDERSRLLGYIVYPLKSKSDATRLRKHLEKHNRFHNVLVVYPDQDEASLELWQGQEQLTGKLRKGQGYKDAAEVVNLLSRFFVVSKAKVKNPSELAQELAYRARYLRRLAVRQLEDEPEKGPLRNLYNAFKEALVHDQTEDEFADAFAQTITYGLLTARWTGNDELMATGERLTRQTALKYLPAASPFLNDLFKSALSVKLDEQRGRLLWLVDDIADLLDRIDVTYVFGIGDKGSDTATDPVIHFYEPFLAAYDKDLKNKRGVFFTPRPVVSYIVRSVHELLQKQFGLEDGLASTDTWGDVAKRIEGIKIPKGVKASDPFVRILDPATGTGTFLFECVEVIERTVKERWCRELKKKSWKDPAVAKCWRDYVPRHLLPRLFGYELMMASYAVAHLKLAFKLAETGYRLNANSRINVFLTNSLEKPDDSRQRKVAGVFPSLAQEAAEVAKIKESHAFSVVIANPPYSGLSANMAKAVQGIVEPYKFVDGEPLNERKHWLQDDYVKFLRFGQERIDTAGVGLLGYITNHAFLDNPTFRGMRQSLRESFDDLRVVDLHGSVKKAAIVPDGIDDQNVFDIQQGVAITIATRAPDRASKISHAELWGSRADKNAALVESNKEEVQFQVLSPTSPYYFFVPKNFDLQDEYDAGWSITDIMTTYVNGIVTARDKFVVDFEDGPILERMDTFLDKKRTDGQVKSELGLKENYAWRVSAARKELRTCSDLKPLLVDIDYRPYDRRRILYHPAVVWRTREKVMRHMLAAKNVGLCTNRQVNGDFRHAGVTRGLINDCTLSTATKERTYLFPLLLFTDPSELDFEKRSGKRANIAEGFLVDLAMALDIPPADVHRTKPDIIFGYIYAVLHSQHYRKRYHEFLRIDFPRIPLPSSVDVFHKLSEIGSRLVDIHLLESVDQSQAAVDFQGAKRAQVDMPTWASDTVWLDKSKSAGFAGVRREVWAYQVGGFQVCKKWLSDRKGRVLTNDEVKRYKKIAASIAETLVLVERLDSVVDAHGGWAKAFVTAKKGSRK